MKHLNFFLSMACFALVVSSSFGCYVNSMSHYNFDLEVTNTFGCNTFSVGISIERIYIETTVTLCCTNGDVFLDCIKIRGKRVKEYLEYDATKILVDHNAQFAKHLKITSSSMYINKRKHIKIRQKTYKILENNLVNFEFVLIE